MRGKKWALAAAGFAVVALASNIPALSDTLAYPGTAGQDYASMVGLTIGVIVVSILAIGLLVGPVLTGRGARYQQVLAAVSMIVIGSLTLFGFMFAVLAFSDIAPGYAGWTTLGIAAGAISFGFAIATVAATGPGRPGKTPTT
jgi:hypothetical protein